MIHDDDLTTLMCEVGPHHMIPSRYVHQHDTEIPKEDWLLTRLCDEYTALTTSTPRENLPIPWNDISELRESPRPD